MKIFTFTKQKLAAITLSLLCAIASISCWNKYSDDFLGDNVDSPTIAVSGSITGSTVKFSWDEPDVSTYSGIKILCTGGTSPVEKIFLRGDKSNKEIPLNKDIEYTVSIRVLYTTGYEVENMRFRMTLSGSDYYAIRFIYNAEQLNNINTDISDGKMNYYFLMADIYLSSYADGEGWVPIGTNTPLEFKGIFEGNGHSINGLTINRAAQYQGLFGYTYFGSMIRNLELKDVNIRNVTDNSGALVGCNNGTISNCHVTGSLSGTGAYFGGVVGDNTGSIYNSSANMEIKSSNTSNGGFVGYHHFSGNIQDCFATGSVTCIGNSNTGGFAGVCNATIKRCYATGSVHGYAYVGGFTGTNDSTIENCYATGPVIGTSNTIGGFAGSNDGTGKIFSSYAIGMVAGSSFTGGFVGSNSANLYACYYDTDTTKQNDASVATGLPTSQMKNALSYNTTYWDFTGIWAINPGINNGYPYLLGMVP
jgi:hypothetical protein